MAYDSSGERSPATRPINRDTEEHTSSIETQHYDEWVAIHREAGWDMLHTDRRRIQGLSGLLISAVLGMSPAIAHSSPRTPGKPGISDVVVRTLEATFPDSLPGSDYKMDSVSQFLWDQFANKPEELQFSMYTTVEAKGIYSDFARELVAKAREQSLDAASLDSCLVRVLRRAGSGGILPVGAYAAHRGEIPIWIIVIKWEGYSDDHPLPVTHTAVSAFDARTYKRVGFVSCG